MGLGATVVLVISGTRDRQGTDEGGGRQERVAAFFIKNDMLD